MLTVELHRSFLYILFFQEKTLGDISFKLETKIMNFMSGLFLKNITVLEPVRMTSLIQISLNWKPFRHKAMEFLSFLVVTTSV
jgi:hypothetical protein